MSLLGIDPDWAGVAVNLFGNFVVQPLVNFHVISKDKRNDSFRTFRVGRIFGKLCSQDSFRVVNLAGQDKQQSQPQCKTGLGKVVD